MIDLLPSEIEAMVRVLDEKIPSLRVEIHRADTKSFREQLQAEERLLVGVREKLAQAIGRHAPIAQFPEV